MSDDVSKNTQGTEQMRDRLAALLHGIEDAEDLAYWMPGQCDGPEAHMEDADRLIANGVTIGLDVERLARALDNLYERRWGPGPFPGQTTINLGHAEAIAREYNRG